MAHKELTKIEISNLSPVVKKAIQATIDNPRYVGDYSEPTDEQRVNHEIIDSAMVFVFDGIIYHMPAEWRKDA